jgi:protein-tyrosine phosphatase
MHVVVVCTANLARSPLFAAMLADRLDGAGVTVSSAGTRALEDMRPAGGSVQLAADRGLDLASHRSQPVTPELIDQADLVLTMSEGHRDRCAMLGAGAASRVFTVREFVRLLDGVDPAEVPEDGAKRLLWLRDEAHRNRPRLPAAAEPEDVADPIRAPWPVWEAMGAQLDELLDRIVPRE